MVKGGKKQTVGILNSEVGPGAVPKEWDYAAASMRPPAHRGIGLHPGGKWERKEAQKEAR